MVAVSAAVRAMVGLLGLFFMISSCHNQATNHVVLYYVSALFYALVVLILKVKSGWAVLRPT
jgi:hypothetical protein